MHRTRPFMRLFATVLLLLAVGGSGLLSTDQDHLQRRAEAAGEAASPRAEQEALLRRAEAAERTDRAHRSPPAERRSQADAAQASPAPPAPEPEPEPEPAPAEPSTPEESVPASCAEYDGNRATGCAVLLDAGFPLDQMSCLDRLWEHESGWNHRAQNPSSGAYGIPQALPGDKMASHGDDWRTNPATQIRWGLDYIGDRYGTPCGAWQFWQANNWY